MEIGADVSYVGVVAHKRKCTCAFFMSMCLLLFTPRSDVTSSEKLQIRKARSKVQDLRTHTSQQLDCVYLSVCRPAGNLFDKFHLKTHLADFLGKIRIAGSRKEINH